MNLLKKQYFGFIVLIIFSVCLSGCVVDSKESSSNSKDSYKEEIVLDYGAILKSQDGKYELYDFKDDNYSPMETEKTVLIYDRSTLNYVYTKNDEFYFVNKEENFKIPDNQHIELKMSPNDKYLSYFVDDNGLKLKIINTKNKEEVYKDSKVSISGTLYDWYDENTLVYYGVSEKGVNGIFTYDFTKNKEELFYEIKTGYLSYLEMVDENLMALELDFDNNRKLISFDKINRKSKILSSKIIQISDIILENDSIYLLGKEKQNIDSIYEIEDNKVKRLIYDFPTVVKTKKKMQKDANGNILFIGSNSDSMNREQIYKYSVDGNVSVLSKSGLDYMFVNFIR